MEEKETGEDYVDTFLDMEDVHHLNHKRTELELLQAKRAITELKEAVAKLTVTLQIREIQDKRSELEREIKSRTARIAGISKEIGLKYDLDMSSIAYDDETGKVNHL